MKFLLWLIVGALFVVWLLRNKKSPPSTQPPRQRSSNADTESAEAMLQCRHCGIHIPASEAVLDSAGTAFCSESHRLLHVPK
jgi:uncharacterized protein